MREALAKLDLAIARLNAAPFPTPGLVREAIDAAHAALVEVAARVENLESQLNERKQA